MQKGGANEEDAKLNKNGQDADNNAKNVQQDVDKSPDSGEESSSKKAKELMAKGFNKDTMVGKIVQIILGLFLGWLTLWIGTILIKHDSDNIDESAIKGKLKEFMILDGKSTSGDLSQLSMNTILPFSPNYISLPFSSNIKGGSQYSYSFWLNVQNPDDLSLMEKPILLRGDNKTYTYTRTDTLTGESLKFTDYVTMSPMICFGKNKLDFQAFFNTTNNIKETFYAPRIESTDSVFRNNVLQILEKGWFLLTFTFEDNIAINEFENGIRVCMYVNDIIYNTQMFKGSLKLSSGNMYFFPTRDSQNVPNGVSIASVRYFNYALDLKEVTKLYLKRPNTRSANISKQVYNRINLSQGNLLDYYNT
jgi:hypothetical protein